MWYTSKLGRVDRVLGLGAGLLVIRLYIAVLNSLQELLNEMLMIKFSESPCRIGPFSSQENKSQQRTGKKVKKMHPRKRQ